MYCIYSVGIMKLSFPFSQTVPTSGQGRSESPVYTNLQELKITKSNLPPLPSGLPLHVIGDWETYKDQSGRHYYCNRSTQERTWKPPRTKDAVSGNSREDGHSAGESSEVKENNSLTDWCQCTGKAILL
ncbi:hypothetical protein GOODEAATRI_010606 [Goodea atripinnis]|uniref:WW domain-containing protein n=1 Tax=Goodea atripinnis TaxID=208336 RepID=A0ABV0P320_9TELE